MTTNDIERADQLSQTRAILFYALGACMIGSSLLGTGHPVTPARIVTWLLLGVLTALNLTGFCGWRRGGSVRALMNDDSTREHRRMSFEVGFWAMTICSLILFAVTALVATDLSAGDTARIVTSAGLASALISFATLELRASRG